MASKVRVAACHIAPVYLDADATTNKALSYVDQAVSNGAALVAFAESFIPGFPLFAATAAPVDNEGHFPRFVEQSIYADGPQIARLRAKAKEKGVVISIGFSERSRQSVGCLWNSNVLIAEDGNIIAHHRKLMPTFYEKLVWSPGDGAGLVVGATARCGRVGALICGENTNPLARFSMMAQAEQIHIMSYPPAWPTKRSGGYKNVQVNALRAAAHCFEAKCYTILVAQVLDEETRRAVSAGDAAAAEVVGNATQAKTQFFGPDSMQLGDEMGDTEGIAYAEFDLGKCVELKQLHDVAGGYQRYDIFDLKVTRRRDEPVSWR